jgi:hypothetical protein
VARSFVASAFQVCEQPPALVDDARLAVSELLTVYLLAQAGPLEVVITEEGLDLVITISSPSSLPRLSFETAELVGRLASGLDEADGRCRLHFSRR